MTKQKLSKDDSLDTQQHNFITLARKGKNPYPKQNKTPHHFNTRKGT